MLWLSTRPPNAEDVYGELCHRCAGFIGRSLLRQGVCQAGGRRATVQGKTLVLERSAWALEGDWVPGLRPY